MKIMVIDGNSIVNRAFYGIKALANKDGMFTNGIFGFLTTYFKLIKEEKPDKTVVCFDVRAKTFRHLEFEDYKGTRKTMPDELAMQMPVLKEILDAMGIARYELAGYEADDLMGTISQICEQNDKNCLLVTGDKDSLQLATNKTTINLISTKAGKTITTKYDIDKFREEYGFEPMILCDLKGLMGDTSDNIPGVKGVGEKTAMSLLHYFGNIEGIYQNINDEKIKKGAREKLVADQENAYKSRKLATIIKDVDFGFDINYKKDADFEKLYTLFEKLQFRKFINEMELIPSKKQAPKVELIVPKYKKITTDMQIEMQGTACISGDLEKLAIIDEKTAYIIENPSDDMLKTIFESKTPKVMHNAKDILVKLLEKGIKTSNIKFDTALAMYLLDPSKSEYKLEEICEELLGVYPQIEEKELSLFEVTPKEDDILISCLVISKVYKILDDNLGNMQSLYYDIELPLMTVLADMQNEGVKIDIKELKLYGEKIMEIIKELTLKIYEKAGQEFNINSPKQLGEILFEKLGLRVIKKTKTGYSTNVDVLQALKDDHPIIENIIEYRTLAKLHSTYVEGLLKVIKKDGKIHSTFNQMVTTTGRLSSTDPNLQNIPVRTKIGAELRKMFIVENENNVLIDADYSQIELRILAHIANDEVMINAFKDGIDIHTVTASQVFNTPIEQVDSLMRSRAKAVNFGIVYGISEFSLGIDIGVSRAEAKTYMNNYLEKYSGVSSYMENIKKKAHDEGYVTTLFNRRRDLPEIKSSNFNTRSFGERVALNTPIQGTSADIIKIAMVNVYNRLEKEKLKSKLILQIHDELIIESPKDESEYVAKLLKEEMQNAFKGKVELTVDYNFGKNWLEAK